MKKRVLATLLAMSMVLGLAACGSKSDSKDDKKEETKTEAKADDAEDVELQVFIAASLSKVMDEVATEYQKDHPNVKITFNADDPGDPASDRGRRAQSYCYSQCPFQISVSAKTGTGLYHKSLRGNFGIQDPD